MDHLTKEQIQQVIEAADAVISAQTGKNAVVHRDNTKGMERQWDNLNDRYAGPEIVKAIAQLALSALGSEPGKQPVAVLDVQSCRPDGHKFALLYSSAAHKLPDDVYLLYPHAQPSKQQRLDWIVRVIDALGNIASEYCDADCIADRLGISYEEANWRANGAQELEKAIYAYTKKIKSEAIDCES